MGGGGVILKPVVGRGAKDVNMTRLQEVELEMFSRISSFLWDSINCHLQFRNKAQIQSQDILFENCYPGQEAASRALLPPEDGGLLFYDDSDISSKSSSGSSEICPLIPSMSSSSGLDAFDVGTGTPTKLAPVQLVCSFPPKGHELAPDTPLIPTAQEMQPTPEDVPQRLQSLAERGKHRILGKYFGSDLKEAEGREIHGPKKDKLKN